MKSTRTLVFVVLALMASGPLASFVRAQQVVIVTTTITGTIDLGGIPITNVALAAATPGVTTSFLALSPGGATSAPYTLTVGVVQGTTPTYLVEATVHSDGGRDNLLLLGTVVVGEGSPAHLNLSVQPGFIDVSFAVSGGASIVNADLRAEKSVSSTEWLRSMTSMRNGAGDLRFPAAPAEAYRVSGFISLSNGLNVQLPVRFVDVAVGQTTTISYDIDGAGAGSLQGTVTFDGPSAVGSVKVQAFGPSSSSVTIDPVATGGVFSVGPLFEGSYNLSAIATLNAGHNQFGFPSAAIRPSSRVDMPGGGPVEISARQSVITAPFTIRGLDRLPSARLPLFTVLGKFDTPTQSGYASTDAVNPAGAFALVTGEGEWGNPRLNLRLERLDPFVNQSMFYTDPRFVTVAADAPAVMPMDFELGEISVHIVRADGGVLTRPSLRGSCTHRDENGGILWTYLFDALSSQENVAHGIVTFVGPAATCSVDGSYTANGQTVGIPAMTLVVVPGVSRDIDAGGPAVTLTSPAAGTIVTTNAVVVSGRATDDTGIAAVTVNGAPVAFASTGNALDPNEVAFEATILLPKKGPVTIATAVTDVANPAKTTTDRRTIYWDTDAPTLTFTPLDGTTTTSSSISVIGRADDDGGVKQVSVNGVPVSFSKTNNAAKPNEVAFSRVVALATGTNAVTVSVTDFIDQTVSETHTITRITQAPTVLTTAPVSGVYGGTVAMCARLTLTTGAGLGGKTVRFTTSGRTATAVTAADGTATVAAFPIAGIDAGAYAMTANFIGDATNAASAAAGTLTVLKATPTVSVAGGTFLFDGQPHPASGIVTGVGGESPGLVTFTYSSGGVATNVPTEPGMYIAVGRFAGSANYVAAVSQPVAIVINAAPLIAGLDGPLTPIAVNTPAQITAAFGDAMTNDTHTCSFGWAEGVSTSVAAGAGQASCTSSYTYAAAGVYTVTVSVTDDDQLSDSDAFQYVVVYDPAAGFVTGSGWIDSPAGAYQMDATLTGKAHFGFVSRYQRGATVPTGSTEFKFEVANLRFQSTSYDWLVIAGMRAQFKGRGSINGAGDYGFLATALDAGPGGASDTFRIKIWDRATGAIVYDNVGGVDDLTSGTQAIGAGNIRIQAGT